jgi:AcrR family transcriptional regulator
MTNRQCLEAQMAADAATYDNTPSTKSGTARPGVAPETRDAVLDAAAAMFNERGYLGTSVDDIADVLGSTKGRIYHLYRSKTDLFLDVHLASLTMMLSLVRPIADDASLAPPEKLRRMAFAQVMAIMTSEPLQKAGLQGLQRHHLDISTLRRQKAMQRVIEMRDEYENVFARVLNEGIATNDFANVPPRLVTKPLQGALNWTLVWFDPERRSSRKEIEEIALKIADFIVGGARGGAPAGRAISAAAPVRLRKRARRLAR